MNGYGSIWNKIPGLIEALHQCIANKWSARQTAAKISELAGQPISRNAMIGAARRRGMRFGSEDEGQYPRKPKAPRQVPINIIREKVPSRELPDELPMQANFLGLTIAELGDNQCRYPAGEQVPYLFCGQPQWVNSPYCRHHHLICNIGFPAFKKQGKKHELHGAPGRPLPHSAGRSG